MMKRTAIRPKRATPRRRIAPKEQDPGWWDWATSALLRRSGGRCERKGCDLYATGLERHHRQRRTVGGDRLSNLLALCSLCHRWITEHPEEARANGWIVSTSEPDPAAVPVVIEGWRWTLDDAGHRTPVP